jgi:serine/threonine protein kinase
VSIENKKPREIAEMEKEVEILHKLSHPNIIRLHKALRTRNNLYLFTDYCDKGDLKTFIKSIGMQEDGRIGGRLSESEARYVISQVVESMKFLNQHNIVHRDIKIDNILVKSKHSDQNVEANDKGRIGEFYGLLNKGTFHIEDFEFKVADLGLAKAISSPDDWIKTMCGTPICMAPEIVSGRLYNYKVHVWSVGTLLFHLLTGTYPFKGRNLIELKC